MNNEWRCLKCGITEGHGHEQGCPELISLKREDKIAGIVAGLVIAGIILTIISILTWVVVY